MNYKVSDLIIRIKNAARARRREVALDNLNINKAICKVLVRTGFLESFESVTKDEGKILVAKIKYDKREPVLNDVEIFSKPSLRKYVGANDILRIERRGKHIVVISTNEGIMTGREAQKKNIGGEVLFKIW